MGKGMQKPLFLLQGTLYGRKVIGCVGGAAGGFLRPCKGDDPGVWSSRPGYSPPAVVQSPQPAGLFSFSAPGGRKEGEMLTFSSTFAQVECNSVFL